MGLVKLWSDKEIGGRIYLQFCEFGQAFPKDKNDQILNILMSVMHKLTAMKYHKENYNSRLKSKMTSFQSILRKHKADPEGVHQEENFDLICELEAFLFQTKSCLDILIKILAPICDLSYGSLFTFGSKGALIQTLLDKNVSKVRFGKERIAFLIKIIEDNKKPWLDYTIALRDRLSHKESTRMLLIGIKRLPNDDLVAQAPLLEGMDISFMLDIIYSNCINFAQDFFVHALFLLLPQSLIAMKADEKDLVQKYNTDSAKYIKYSIGMSPDAKIE